MMPRGVLTSMLTLPLLPLLIAAAPPTTRGERAERGDRDNAAATRPAVRTWQATRELSIPGFTPDDEFFVAMSERAGQLGAEKAGLPEHNLSDWLSVGGYQGGLQIAVGLKNLQPPPPPVAAEIADELVDFTSKYVTEQHEAQRRRAEQQLNAAAHCAAEAEQRVTHIRQQLRELSGRSDVSPDTLTGALAAVDEEVQKLKLERLAKESRRKALEEEIARAAERIQKRVESDPIAAELQKVVQVREQAVQQLRELNASGRAAQGEVSEAIAKAAEARAKMLQQQREAAAAAGGSALESFNRELMTLAIDARETEAKLEYLEERLPRLRAAVELLDQFERAAREETAARLKLDALRESQPDRASLTDGPPRVLIKASGNDPLPPEQ